MRDYRRTNLAENNTMKFHFLLGLATCVILYGCDLNQQPLPALTSSPFYGDIGMREGTLWFQLSGNGDARDILLEVWNDSTEVKTYRPTSAGLANCYHVLAHDLMPGQSYNSLLTCNGHDLSDTLKLHTQVLWQYREDPPSFKIATGSCSYINETKFDRPGKPYGGESEIFETLAQESADAMFWLGDNVYLREADLGSIHGYIHRYNHTRSTPEIQKLLSSGVHYAIWDDHDFGPNDCDGSWIHQDWAKRTFDAFWANPESGLPGAPELNTTTFLLNDVQVFLLDNRTHRVNHGMGGEKRQMLGTIQMEWLLNGLRNSRAPFKLVAIGGQMLSDAAIYENFAQFPEERAYLLEELDRLDIRGVVFLTGDRHNSELTKFQLPQGNWVYDLTVSPLTSGSYDHTEEPNTLRVEGTMVGVRNYATLEFSGPRKERVLKMTVKDKQGEQLWTRSIHAGKRHVLSPE